MAGDGDAAATDATERLETLFGLAEEILSQLNQATEYFEEQSRANVASLDAARSLSAHLQDVMSGAVIRAVRDQAPAQTERLVQALTEAGERIAQRQEQASHAARGATHQLEEATARFRSQWWRAALGASVVGLCVLMLGGWSWSQWLRYETHGLLEQRAELAAQVEQMQVNAKAWEKKAGKAKLEHCRDGEHGRPRLCVRVDESAGRFGRDSSYAVIWGY